MRACVYVICRRASVSVCVRACVCMLACVRMCVCVCVGGGGSFCLVLVRIWCVRCVCLSCIYSFLFKTVLIYLLVICFNWQG